MSELPIRDRVTALLRNGKWSRWISRGTWTLIDRGLFALSNFTLNIVLARWMSVEDYGAFAIAFSIFLIIGAAQSSLVVGPLLVFGPKRYRDRYEEYLGLLIIGQLVLSLFVSVGLVLVAGGFFLWGSTDIGAVLLALALAGPFILQVWLLRQSGYVKFQSKRAAGAGVVYMVLLMAGTFLLNSLAILSPATALFLMAAVSLSVAVWLSIQQRARFFGVNFLGSFASDIALQHWRYARWMLPARLVNAARSNLLFFVLAAWGGLDATGAMRALMNLVMPIAFMEHSLNLITVPILVRARISRTLGEKVILGMVLFVVGSLVYAAALVLFQDEIIAILYSDRYRSYVNLVWIVALIPVVQSASSIPSATLNAMERPKAIFWALLGGATCTATVGLGAVAIAGLLGAIVALLISAGVIMVLLLWFLRVALRDEVADHAK